MFCWYSAFLISNWLWLTPLQLQKDMQKLGRSQPPTTAGSTPQYSFWSILASCQGVLCPRSELWYIWASKWNQETISVSSGRSTWQSTTVSWCFMRNLNMIMISGSAALKMAWKVDTSAVFHQLACHRRLNQLEANILTCSGSKHLRNVWWSDDQSMIFNVLWFHKVHNDYTKLQRCTRGKAMSFRFLCELAVSWTGPARGGGRRFASFAFTNDTTGDATRGDESQLDVMSNVLNSPHTWQKDL